MRATGGIHNYPQFVLTGLAVWTFFQGGVMFGTASLVANGDLMKKVWFPRPVIPTAVVLAQITTSLVMFAVIVPANLITLPSTVRTFLLAIPMLFGLLLLVLGLAFAFATLNVFYRDIEHLLAVLFLPWFFLTPIFYSLESIPAAADTKSVITILRYANPVTPYVEGIRGALWNGIIVGTRRADLHGRRRSVRGGVRAVGAAPVRGSPCRRTLIPSGRRVARSMAAGWAGTSSCATRRPAR